MLEQGKILIVDTDEIFLHTTKIMLEQEGYTCTCLSNIEEVTELLGDDEYDLLIADIWKPKPNPPEFISKIQSKLEILPLIAVTGRPSLESAMQAIQLQVKAYLVKPFETSLLLTEARKAITHTKLAKTAQKIQKRWLERHDQFREAAADMSAAISTPTLALNLMVTAVLGDLAQSFDTLQKLRVFLDPHEGKAPSGIVSAAPLNVAVKVGDSLEREVSSVSLSLHDRGNQQQEKIRPAEVLRQIQLLSRRERDVLRLLLANQKPRTIAQSLFLSLHTVRNHLRSIFEKLAVHSQTELLTLLGRYSTYLDLQETV